MKIKILLQLSLVDGPLQGQRKTVLRAAVGVFKHRASVVGPSALFQPLLLLLWREHSNVCFWHMLKERKIAKTGSNCIESCTLGHFYGLNRQKMVQTENFAISASRSQAGRSASELRLDEMARVAGAPPVISAVTGQRVWCSSSRA